MCGIAALVALNDAFRPFNQIVDMASLLRHRGPDDEGFALFGDEPGEDAIFGGDDTPQSVYGYGLPYTPKEPYTSAIGFNPRVAFGHRRLAIADQLPSSHQPMCERDRRFWIICDGEIYNWRELRNELESLGHNFTSESDAEVILRSYIEWGRDCLDRFNGVWAFIIFDSEEETIFAARDRFGVKPLYYWVSPEGLLSFASEIKAFTVLPSWRPKLNKPRTYDYLVSHTIDHTSETLFEGVRQIRGGEAVKFKIGDISHELPIYKWYQFNPKPYSGSYEEATANLRELIEDSVRLRLDAYGSIGFSLSGGLDSSTVVCVGDELMHKAGVGVQKTFSAYSKYKELDEREYGEEVVRMRGMEAHYTYPSLSEFVDAFEELIWHQDEPFTNASIFGQWSVFKLASESKVKIMFNGHGGDEIFCGYHNYLFARFADLLKTGRFYTLAKEVRKTHDIHGYGVLTCLAKGCYFSLPLNLRRRLLKTFQGSGSSSAWLKIGDTRIEGQLNASRPDVLSGSVGERTGERFFYGFLPLCLHHEDRSSMAHSIESRSPPPRSQVGGARHESAKRL